MGRSGSTHSLVNFSLGFPWAGVRSLVVAYGLQFCLVSDCCLVVTMAVLWHCGDLVELHGSCGTFGARRYFYFHQEVAQLEFWELVS